MKTRALGRHLLIEFYGCAYELINNQAFVREALLEAAKRANSTIVTDVFHSFNPYGVSGVIVIAESHIAVHTWPEHQCASVDIFSCGEKMVPELIEPFLLQVFKATRSVMKEMKRGNIPVLEEVVVPEISVGP